MSTYIAMNTFRVVEGREEGFEETWRNRDRHVKDVEGFIALDLLRGRTEDGVTGYISHSRWASEAAFVAWTRSDAFRKAHADARSPEGTLAGPPAFAGWHVILSE